MAYFEENFLIGQSHHKLEVYNHDSQDLIPAINIFIILLTVALTIMLAMPVTAANVTKVEVHGMVFDEKSTDYNKTLMWDAQNFTGFWYDLKKGKSSETLQIDHPASSLTASSRGIQEDELLYRTTRTEKKYDVFNEKGKKVEKGLEYDSTTGFTRNTTGGYYARLGWFGGLYVAVNGKANKLARLVKEQKKEEKKTLTMGETWNLGEGYSLTAGSIDAKASPRQTHLILSWDGKNLDDKIVTEGQVYTYLQKKLAGESDVPVFVTYVESIFSGTKSDIVQLRYTWLISQNATEIKADDEFGAFYVGEANEDYLLLYNSNLINLDQNAVIDLVEGIKFKVADDATALRFYPIVEKTEPGTYEVRGRAYDESTPDLIWDAQSFPGFWYSPDEGKSSENLYISQAASSLTNAGRTIEADNLQYNTSPTEKMYAVFSEKGKKVEKGIEYNTTTGTFTMDATGGYYARLGWFGELYVAVNGKANKIARLIKEQKKEEKKTLTMGETWNLGEGYSLTASSIDAKASPRQTHLVLSRDGKKLDDKIVTEGQVYTYLEKKLAGESDVPVFVTYVESIFSGTKSDMLQLRYTWLISQDVTEIKVDDEFGTFYAGEANEDFVLLYNSDPINLDQNAVVDLAEGIKFRVADSSSALRFYPFVENTVLETSQLEVKGADTSITATSTPTPTVAAPVTSQRADVQAAAAAAAQIKVQGGTPGSTSVQKLLGFWGFYAIAGLIATAYLILRKKD